LFETKKLSGYWVLQLLHNGCIKQSHLESHGIEIKAQKAKIIQALDLQNQWRRSGPSFEGARMRLTAIIQSEELSTGDTMYIALCAELDVASQGESRDSALANLKGAVEGLLETADDAEISQRLRSGATVTTMEIAA
jgi:predicted RNase H-like HicB family nuclease